MKSFIITLEGHAFSEMLANECIDQALKFNIYPKKFKAVLGKDVEYHLKSNNLVVNTNTTKVMRQGQFGCFFSHYYLWETCLKTDQPLIILEHDGYFLRELPNNVLSEFEDVLKLDYLTPYSRTYDQEILENKNNPIKYIHNIKGMYGERAWGWYTPGAWAYILKPSGAKKLITFCKTYGITANDNLLADGILKVSLISPTVARLHPIFTSPEKIRQFTTCN